VSLPAPWGLGGLRGEGRRRGAGQAQQLLCRCPSVGLKTSNGLLAAGEMTGSAPGQRLCLLLVLTWPRVHGDNDTAPGVSLIWYLAVADTDACGF